LTSDLEILAGQFTLRSIVLDLSGLEFIDSCGLRMILAACERSSADRDRLRLLRGPPQVQRIFEITATADRLPFAD
jgi:anti-anti-sigma factor